MRVSGGQNGLTAWLDSPAGMISPGPKIRVNGIFRPAPGPRVAPAETIARWFLCALAFSGGFVSFEPSLYELIFVPAALAVLLAGATLHVTALPLVMLLILMGIGGAMAWPQVMHREQTGLWILVSLFLAGTAIFYAMALTRAPGPRFTALMRGYVAAAVILGLSGIAGYFDLFGSGEFLTRYGRAKGFFKDPNVYAPFLVLPLVLLLQRLLIGSWRSLFLVLPAFLVILVGLFLSFSRGAWGNFALAALLMIGFLLVFAPSDRLRLRIFVVAAAGFVLSAGGLAALVAVPEVGDLFAARANLMQSYDVGDSGRFANQARALQEILSHPLGFGPLGYSYQAGREDPHNVYLQAFLAYGWLGGFSYLTLVLLTWIVGLHQLFRPSPYRLPFSAVMASFMALSLQGLVIDTDHWRHFFLALGLVWGFAAAVGLDPVEDRA